MTEKRLQKYIAESGIASRRKAEELIKQGRVKVNNIIVTEMGTKVTENDIVEVDGKKIKQNEEKIYVALNKPTGYVTTAKDQFDRPAVVDLVKELNVRLFPVGRLDFDTSGLLILTNDGDITFKITHPKHEMKKVYKAEIKGSPEEKHIEMFENGIEIEDTVTAPAKLKIIKGYGNRTEVEITIHEGKNRQIRKMFEKLGFPVLKLRRIEIGKIKLGDLPEGKWRYLTQDEVKSLMKS
jgi:23S rRNA pseudouridine2605 synthase